MSDAHPTSSAAPVSPAAPVETSVPLSSPKPGPEPSAQPSESSLAFAETRFDHATRLNTGVLSFPPGSVRLAWLEPLPTGGHHVAMVYCPAGWSAADEAAKAHTDV